MSVKHSQMYNDNNSFTDFFWKLVNPSKSHVINSHRYSTVYNFTVALRRLGLL